MSASLIVIGIPSGPDARARIAEIAFGLHLAVSFDIHPSVMMVAELLAAEADCSFAVDAPESGTATELEAECAELRMAARLPTFLMQVQPLLTRVRLAWTWDFPDPAQTRHQQGSVADLVAVLSRPETWARRHEVSPGVYHCSHDGIYVFHLT